ncbi:AMP-binding protein [Ketobacter sp.]
MTHAQPWLNTYKKLGLDWSQIPDVPAKTLSDYIRDFGQQFADRAALVYCRVTTSYSQLDHQVDKFAHVLQAAGCSTGDVLAIQLPNIPQYVIGMAAAARLGLKVTSVSPLLTPPEVIHQCNDAQVHALLTFEPIFTATHGLLVNRIATLKQVIVASATEPLPGLPDAQIAVDTLGDVPVTGWNTALSGAATDPVEVDVDFDGILYLQYTGGTTGKPKGAQLSSKNIFVNNVQADVFYGYRLGMETVASAFPLFHIGGAAVMMNAIRTASTFLLIADPRNIEQFCGEMTAFPPTVLANVPALFQMLVNSAAFRALDFSQLRIAVSGAAPFSVDEIRRLENVIGTGKFCEVYGMTETAPVQTLNPGNAFKPGFVGLPLPATDLRILDPENGVEELAPGVPGEVVVSGPQVMRGYLAMADASRDALREHDGKVWMHTGDIGFLDDEGYLKICDRSKDMLIVGGYKVFSVEVESKLQSLPFVEMCAVVGREDEDRPGNDVVQVYVQRNNAEPAHDEQQKAAIIEFCRANMAPYKVPKELFFVDAIPLTSVGKIDKKALRK